MYSFQPSHLQGVLLIFLCGLYGLIDNKRRHESDMAIDVGQGKEV